MNRTAQNGRRLALLTFVLPALLGCFFLPSPSPDPPLDPPEYEGCSNDHDTFFSPDESGAEIGNSDDRCNDHAWYAAGGGQGGGARVAHFEPVMFVPDTYRFGSEPWINWTVRDFDTDELVLEQGIELFPDQLEPTDGGVLLTGSQVIIDPDLRGKNLRLEANTEALDERDNVIEIKAAAAIYLGHEG